MMQMPTELLLELRDTFNTYFNEDGLTDFALALNVDYENLSGSGKSAKARELALHLWRHSLLPKLAEIGPKRRSDIDWASILGKHGIYAPAESPVTPVSTSTAKKVKHTDLQKLFPILADRPMFATPEGRKTFIELSGVQGYTSADLNGNAQLVAGSLLVQLNNYGLTADGDSALGLLLAFLLSDSTLPIEQKRVVEEVIERYQL